MIEKTEADISSLEEKISSFDFGDGSSDRAEEYAIISKERDELEENLLLMYEEQEELTEKFNL